MHSELLAFTRRAAAGSGTHRQSSSSLSALVSTLVPCFVLATVLVGLFLLLRVKQKRLYAPRTYHDALADEYAAYHFPSLFPIVRQNTC
jgi:hypothetical protein